MKKLEPIDGVPIYSAHSGHDFALAYINTPSFRDRKIQRVAAVIVRSGKGGTWRDFYDAPSIPGLCVGDILEMARLWKSFTPAPLTCYPRGLK